MLAVCAQICWYFSNWTHKNIPDWQQCVSFRKSQKVKNHSSTLQSYSTYKQYNQQPLLVDPQCCIIQSADPLLLFDLQCCTISWPSPIGWSSMLYNQLTCSYWLILYAVKTADLLLLVDPLCCTISWSAPIGWSSMLYNQLTCSYWLILHAV